MSVLRVDNVVKTFGGFNAVDGVSLVLEDGELRGLIGSNGAGKSTLLHLIYGKLHADGGSIRFRDEDVTRTPAYRRARMGMGLVFQVTSVFGGLTVEENLRLGAAPKDRRFEPSASDQDIEDVLELIDFRGVRSRQAGELSHGQQQWLEIGMVLLTHPKLLLLDEPTSGMTRAESRHTADLLRELQARKAADAIIVVEHNIEFIELVSDRVTVMHRGKVLANGSVAEVQANTEVQASYLGRLR